MKQRIIIHKENEEKLFFIIYSLYSLILFSHQIQKTLKTEFVLRRFSHRVFTFFLLEHSMNMNHFGSQLNVFFIGIFNIFGI